jgi:hypothetical protein
MMFCQPPLAVSGYQQTSVKPDGDYAPGIFRQHQVNAVITMVITASRYSTILRRRPPGDKRRSGGCAELGAETVDGLLLGSASDRKIMCFFTLYGPSSLVLDGTCLGLLLRRH